MAFEGTRWYIDAFPGLVTEDELPPNTLENSQWAVRGSVTFKGWDFSVSYYDGVSHFATSKMEGGKIINFYDQVSILGFDFITTYNQFRFFFEGNHTWSKRRERDDFFNIVFGGDWRRNALIKEHDRLVLTLEMFFSSIVTRKSKNRQTRLTPDIGDRGVNHICPI